MRTTVCLGLLSLASCGDPLADAAYRGTPIFKLEGQITTVDLLPPELLDATFGVSIFWAPEGDLTDPRLVEQPSVTTDVRFPSTFELRVFEPPNDLHFGSATAAWVVGLVLAYVDQDADGVYAEGAADELIGGSLRRGILYARTELESSQSPNLQVVRQGFSVVDLPLRTTCAALPRPQLMGRRGGGFSFTCDQECPAGFVCDARERVCRPDETFNLLITPTFDLRSVICRPE